MMKRLADFRKQVIAGWTVQRIAAVLIVVGLVVGLSGFAKKYCTDWCVLMPSAPLLLSDFLGDFYANIAVDCLSVAFAILVIDRLSERRAEQELKAQLIREMRSSDNGIALRAVEEFRARGGLTDGSLEAAHLKGANLQSVNLRGANMKKAYLEGANLQRAELRDASLQEASLWSADLQGAKLWDTNLQAAFLQDTNLRGAFLEGANLQEADLVDACLKGANLRNANLQAAKGLIGEQLITAHTLRGATMDDGTRYNGRFNLTGDVGLAAMGLAGNRMVVNSRDDPEAMARYYGVTLEECLAGQEWAREHLADLRRETGLDPDNGLPVEPTNGTEPSPADAPALPAPRRNGHKASMVTHRVRR
jgi:hypothetical protein